MHWFSAARGDWTDKDYLLTLAYTIYEDGLCACGQPRVISHHTDNDGWYEIKKAECFSCAAQERATAGSGNTPYTPAPGEKVYTIFNSEGKAQAAARRAALHTTPSP